ncbi:UvrABC system protein C [Acrasis kona]|uniref:UvrABC system protein C n=1 Tax=Acrasis kona TaxID=1008807 RepID=A0AAW2ZFP2_9EUKA
MASPQTPSRNNTLNVNKTSDPVTPSKIAITSPQKVYTKHNVLGFIGGEDQIATGFQNVIPHYMRGQGFQSSVNQIRGLGGKLNQNNPTVIEVIDVSGFGKTTFLENVASELKWYYVRAQCQDGAIPEFSNTLGIAVNAFKPNMGNIEARSIIRKVIEEGFLKLYNAILDEDWSTRVEDYSIKPGAVRDLTIDHLRKDITVLLKKKNTNLLINLDEIQIFTTGKVYTKEEENAECENSQDLEKLLLSVFFNTLATHVTNGINKSNTGNIIFAVSGTYGKNPLTVRSPVKSLKIRLERFTANICLSLFKKFWHFPTAIKDKNGLNKVMERVSGPPRLMEVFLRKILHYSARWKEDNEQVESITTLILNDIATFAINVYFSTVKERLDVSPEEDLVDMYFKLYYFPTLYKGKKSDGSGVREFVEGTEGYNLLQRYGLALSGGLLCIYQTEHDIKVRPDTMDEEQEEVEEEEDVSIKKKRKNSFGEPAKKLISKTVRSYILLEPFAFVREVFCQKVENFDEIISIISRKGRCFEYMINWELSAKGSLLWNVILEKLSILKIQETRPEVASKIDYIIKSINDNNGFHPRNLVTVDKVSYSFKSPYVVGDDYQKKDLIDGYYPLPHDVDLYYQAKNKKFGATSDQNSKLKNEMVKSINSFGKISNKKKPRSILGVFCSLHNFEHKNYKIPQTENLIFITLKGADFSNLNYPFEELLNTTHDLGDPKFLVQLINTMSHKQVMTGFSTVRDMIYKADFEKFDPEAVDVNQLFEMLKANKKLHGVADALMLAGVDGEGFIGLKKSDFGINNDINIDLNVNVRGILRNFAREKFGIEKYLE